MPEENTGGRADRKPILLRLDPAIHAALARWAADDLRSLNAHIELLLRQALTTAGRSPRQAGPLPKRGRPSRRTDGDPPASGTG
ncbi:MAG: hypothetical protein KIT69_12545 [Propionibacteriaceae bacterium]|nr:hypothetical protein [Propionibacteriaceae bacterium]